RLPRRARRLAHAGVTRGGLGTARRVISDVRASGESCFGWWRAPSAVKVVPPLADACGRGAPRGRGSNAPAGRAGARGADVGAGEGPELCRRGCLFMSGD